MKYELQTIKDIYEKVPFDKVDECMSELTTLIKQCKSSEEAMKNIANAITGNPNDVDCQFPDSLEWIDDGMGCVETNVSLKTEDGTNLGGFKLTNSK